MSPRKRKRRYRVLFVLLMILITPLYVAIYAFRDLRTEVTHKHTGKYIEIPRGSNPTQITGSLETNGIIRNQWPLLLYIKLTRSGPTLKAGEYRFPSPITPLGVLKKLQQGEQRLDRFTVIEGWTRWDIAAAMSRVPELGERDYLSLMDNTSEIRDLDTKATNLEGYLYPDTYSFPPDVSAEEMVAQMVKRFRQIWGQKFQKLAERKNADLHNIITIASLIETEAKLKEERPLVSSVIYNRLKKGMSLGIDSTVIYASRMIGKWKNDGKIYQSDLDLNSPYNTRKVAGLPPGL
jgi:UPF0755 protein